MKAIIRDKNQKDSNKYQFDTLWIFSWNRPGFPWRKCHKLSWIPSEIDIILFVETWEHKESKVPDIDGYVLWLIWNKCLCRRGIGGISYYIRKNISTHVSIYKKDLYNQFIWIEIIDINDEKTYIAICYFPPINSNFYKRKLR